MKIRKPPLGVRWLINCLLLAIFYFAVWYTGGTSNAWPHLFYIPIILTALVCSWKSSLITALISGLLLSQWLMPLRKDPLIYQQTSVWLLRLVMFAIVSLWTSLVFRLFKKQTFAYQEQITELFKIHKASLHALVDLAEMHDYDVTGKHLNRLEYYARLLTDYLGLDKELSNNIIDTIALHDVGKVAVPEAILHKPGPLTEKEWEIMKKHPIQGTQILKSIEAKVNITNPSVRRYTKVATEIVLYHHEKWDGTGYPIGLKGKAIPISARIAALCDVYDSLRSQRPYKRPYTHKEAKNIICDGKGKHFDPKIVKAFQALEDEFDRVWREQQTPQLSNLKTISSLVDLPS